MPCGSGDGYGEVPQIAAMSAAGGEIPDLFTDPRLGGVGLGVAARKWRVLLNPTALVPLARHVSLTGGGARTPDLFASVLLPAGASRMGPGIAPIRLPELPRALHGARGFLEVMA